MTTFKNELINNLINNKRLKITDIFTYYKYNLITKQLKDEVKKEIIKKDYVKEMFNKNDKLIGYFIIEDNKDKFKKWLNDNLVE